MKVSVILTTYNSESSLQRTLDSIYNQTGIHKEFELQLIVVDDCSTDQTQAILKRNNIEFFTTNNNSGGPNRGRNLGLNQSDGDAICFIDHDDEWMPNKVLQQIQLLKYAPIVTCGHLTMNTQENRSYQTKIPERCSDGFALFEINETFISKLTARKGGQNTYFGGLMIDSSLDDVTFEEEIGKLDYDYILRLFYGRRSVEFCAPLFKRNVDGSNLSLDEEYRLQDYHYGMNFIDQYVHEFPHEVYVSRKRFNGTLARYYYLVDEMSKARHYFMKSELSPKTIMYYLTTFAGSSMVKKYFKVFG